jgi:DegV family protein with EDD domain
MTVKIVVDSLADLPAEEVERYGIEVIPLTVRFGSTEFKDGIDLSADEFYRRLETGDDYPATAVPSIGEFVELYERVGKGASGIISIHVSSKVSGTYNAAVQGAREANAGCPIEVVDSLQASMGIGLMAMVASRAAAAGADLPTIVSEVADASTRVKCTTLLDTLEYLQKGGRIGKAQALVGTLLSFKPMIEVTDGLVHPFARPRSRKKGVVKLIERVRELAPVDQLVVLHSTTPDEALALRDQLADLTEAEPIIARYGPGLGTYVGPGALGVGALRSEAN